MLRQFLSAFAILVFLVCTEISSSRISRVNALEQQLIASDVEAYDGFGRSVAISGDRAIAGSQGDNDKGSQSGSAYIFTCGGDGVWREEKKLTASDGAEYDGFGGSVAITGNWALVGAYGDDDKGNSAGSVYVFRRGGDGAWREVQKLLSSDGHAGDYFGLNIAASGDRVIIGAFMDDDKGSSSGSAYIYGCGADSVWREEQKLVADDGEAYDDFGRSVAISGNRAIVGAFMDDDKGIDAGSAYVFEHGVDNVWHQAGKLVASDGAAYDEFGFSVAISGDRAIVGADGDDDKGNSSGSVYIYERETDGVWQQVQKLYADHGLAGDVFGQSVAIFGVRAISGAPGDNNGAGATYVFNRETDGIWRQVRSLLAFNGSGQNVAISGDRVIAGANGSAYVNELGSVTAVNESSTPSFALSPNVPNPFNPSTAIRFSLPASGATTLAVYTVQGQFVRSLVAGDVTAGAHEVVWDGTDSAGRSVASGIYLYRLTHPSGEAVHRMTLLR